MKYHPQAFWQALPINANDFRPRFFVELFKEKLGIDTPHFYQSRLMSVFSSCAEALVYIDEHRDNKKSGIYLNLAVDEIEFCWKRDSIVEGIFGYIEDAKSKIFKAIRSGDFSSSVLNSFGVICNAILSREDEYLTKMLSELHLSLTDNSNLAQIDRITKRIDSLTGLYVTYLLYKGFSPTYLFNRSSLFEARHKYGPRDFSAQFLQVTERLRDSSREFDVFFALKTHNPQQLLTITDDPDFSFSEGIDPRIQGRELAKFQRDDSNVFVMTKLVSTDYVSAAWKGKEKLNKFLDAVTGLELNPRISVAPTSAVVTNGPIHTHVNTLNIEILVGYLASERGTNFSNSLPTIRNSSVTLSSKGQERLGRSLRYLRLARESISLEPKLLNLWISLESIFSDGETGIISSISRYIPRFYAVIGLRRRVAYLRALLVKNEIPTTALYRANIDNVAAFSEENVNDEKIFKLLRNRPATEELVMSLGDMQHLKFRLISTFFELEDNAKIISRIEKSETDVARQLRRIYFLRNKIAHSGHYDGIRPQLLTHLVDYIAVCYFAISSAVNCSKSKGIHSIDDLILSYNMGLDAVIKKCKSPTPIIDLCDLLPRPII